MNKNRITGQIEGIDEVSVQEWEEMGVTKQMEEKFKRAISEIL